MKLEKVGSNMTEAVILSVIESLDCWLLKKEGILEENLEKLSSLIVGMLNLGEEDKEMLYNWLLQFEKEGEDVDDDERHKENLFNLLDFKKENSEEDKYERERTKEMLYSLLKFNKEKVSSLVVGMAKFWENNKGNLYCLLFLVANQALDSYDLLVEERDDEGELNKRKLHRLLVEIADLWGDDEGELNKEKLHSLLFQMLNRDNYLKKKIMCRISGEVAGLWKDKHPKLNKEKLYTWLANKVDLNEAEYLFRVVFYDSSYVHKSIREGVEAAKREFSLILDLIIDKKLGKESSLRYFISDVVDMAHDVCFLIHLKDSDPFALFFELTVLLQALEYKTYYKWFGQKFKHIVNGLQEIKMSMLGFGVERLQNIKEMEGVENVVGLEEDVKLLLCDEGTVIKGMAGIGKTTLARQLYNHTTIAQQFQRRAWVCLSKVFSRKEILVSLIQQVVDSNELASLEKIECADYKSLKQVLRQQLLGMRYFIVLDDVWDNTTHFEYVETALPKDKGSRLVLTTRSLSMWCYRIYEMKFMDDDKSWTLLLKTLSIEGSGEEFPKPLVKKARHILRRCGGLPLAIKEVGRHWAKKRQFGTEWEELIESIDLSETLRTLESVYDNWDQELKSRFLHLAFFKEGATIRAKKLVQIWNVMGVVPISKEISYNLCLARLWNESIIDVIDRDKKGYIKTCCIHAIFHMLSISKAEDELNFEILNSDGNNKLSHQCHHRAIYCSREELMNYSSNHNRHLVSLFLYGGGYFNASPSYWTHFEQLKTLDMEDFGLKILPDVIGMLGELRYLGLRNNYIQKLPHSLSRLKNLEVLDIALNFMVEVEDIMWEMESLRHLYMTDISCQNPLRIDTLENLETLTYISVHNWAYEAPRLEIMTSLTKLGIQELDGNSDLSKLFASLAELENLGFLILRGSCFKSMPSLDEIGILENLWELKLDGLITRLPSANNFPPKIRHLSLVNSCLHEDPMPILEKLSFLTYLKLQNAYSGQQMVISHNGFFELCFLAIERLWHLTNVQIEKGAMKKLEDLEINNCPNLETLPEDYFSTDYMTFKMTTTKKNATKIRESSFVSKIKKMYISSFLSRIKKVDIQP